MEKRITTFVDIIDMWPSRLAMKTDVERFMAPPKRAHVRDWVMRDSIPIAFFDAVILAAEGRGFLGVTYPLLSELWKQAEQARKAEQDG